MTGVQTCALPISTNIIVPVWIATLMAAIAAITTTKLFMKLEKRKKR